MSTDHPFTKYLSALAGSSGPSGLFATLDEAGFAELEGRPDCYSIQARDLIRKVFLAASLATKFQPAFVNHAGRQFEAALSMEERADGLRIALSPVPPVAGTGGPVIVSFNLFGSSYCLRAMSSGLVGDEMTIAWPDRMYMRRRRRTDRLVMANPIEAEMLMGAARVPVEVVNLSENGACLALSGTPSLDWTRIRAIMLDLPRESVELEAEVRWTHDGQDRTWIGMAFSAGAVEMCRRLAGRRRAARQELARPEPCRLLIPGGSRVEGVVRDLTEMGARVQIPAGGLPDDVRHLRFSTVLDGVEVRMEAEVRWSESRDDAQFLGLRFAIMQADVRERLLGYLVPRMRPNFGEVSPDELDQVIEIFDAVNYFGQTGKGEKARMALDDFRRVWSRILASGRHLGRLLCVRESGRVVGVCAVSRVYTATWLTHSMAAVRGVDMLPAEHLRIGHLEELERELTTEFIMGFFLLSKRYSQKYYMAAVSIVQDPDQHHWFTVNVVDYDLHRVDVAGLPEGDCGPATADETVLFCDLVGRRYPRSYVQSISLGGANVALGLIADEHDRIGIARDRRLLVQREGGRPVAFCLVEITSPGLSLNGCTDGFWLFPVSPPEETDGRSLLPLVRSALRVASDLGRTRVNFFCERLDPRGFVVEGATVIPDLCIWVGTVEAAAEVRALWKGFYDQHKLDRVGEMMST